MCACVCAVPTHIWKSGVDGSHSDFCFKIGSPTEPFQLDWLASVYLAYVCAPGLKLQRHKTPLVFYAGVWTQVFILAQQAPHVPRHILAQTHMLLKN